MTPIKSTFFCCSLLLLATLCLAPGFSTAADSQSAKEIERRLQEISTRPAEEIDLAETLLLISQHRQPSLNLKLLAAELDRLTDSARDKLKNIADGKAVVEVLRDTIHSEGGYRYTDAVDERGIPIDPAELFLHGMLKTRAGYCMNLSLLYLILGDRLDQPLFGVPLPNHFFVRYQSATERINIEATESGSTYPDSFYFQRFGLDSSSPFFMRNLDKRQTLGAYFSNVGMVYYRDTRPQEAVFYLDLSTRINPLSIEAQNNLANIYSELQQWDKAVHHYQLALKAEPANISTLFNLGLAYKDKGESNKAIEALLQGIQIDPGFAPAHQALANLYGEEDRPFAALLHLKKLAALDPGNVQIQIALGKTLLQTNQTQLAMEIFNRLLAQNRENLQVLESLAEIYYRQEQFDNASETYRFMIEYHPDHLKAYIQLGWTHYRKGEIEKAAAWTKQGLKRGKGSNRWVTLAQMNLGFYAVLDRDFPEAKNRYRQALSEKDPGAVESMTGDLREAKTRYPGRPELDFFSGWIYSEAGQKARAEKTLSYYLAQNPASGFAEEARAILERISGKKPQRLSETNGRQLLTDDTQVQEGMASVEAGFFIMGSNAAGEDERPPHRVFLDAFLIDKTEVSAKEFARFLNQASNVKAYYLDNKYGMLFYDGRFHPRKGLQSYPINNVNWEGANEFCRWKNKRLPTEAEWEKAARGDDQRKYPWGDQPPSAERARYFQTWTEELQHRVMVPVNSQPEGKSHYGLYHMAGNVKEWVDDWFDREYYKDQSSQVNPRGPIGGEFKVLRGGSWRDLPGFIYSSFRNNSYSDTRLDDYGFRCARSLSKDAPPKKLTWAGNPRIVNHRWTPK